MCKQKHIRCAECRFVRVDKAFCEGSWTAYECGNPKSEFHRSLLNVNINGDKLPKVCWSGCAEGRVSQ
jgi:hypothetical protein